MDHLAPSSRKYVGNTRKKLANDATESLGKLPPQAVDIEEVVLGALMLEQHALSSVIDILKAESFYKEAHQNIFEAIVQLFNNSDPVDIKTVVHQLRKNGKLELVGGSYYVSDLTTRVNSAANIEYHARIISEQSIKRQLIRISSELVTDAYEDTTDVFQLLDRTEQALFQVSESHIRKNYDKMSSLLTKAISQIEERKNQKDGITGVPSGFTALDRITSGWQPSDLVIIAARPGMGKTAFVVSAMRNAAIDHGQGVAIFSLEMSSVQLVNRLISSEAELESEKLKRGEMADYEWEQLLHKTSRLSEAPVFIDDTPGLSILELRAKARRLAQQHDIKLLIIDYLQLMSGGDTNKNSGGNREQEIASISRALKGIAKELNIPVIALSQLSRAVETRGGDKKPQLSDLRESGSIEQDADVVMFVYRESYYLQGKEPRPATVEHAEWQAKMNEVAHLAQIIIGKQRHGPIGNVTLEFEERFTKFKDTQLS